MTRFTFEFENPAETLTYTLLEADALAAFRPATRKRWAPWISLSLLLPGSVMFLSVMFLGDRAHNHAGPTGPAVFFAGVGGLAGGCLTRMYNGRVKLRRRAHRLYSRSLATLGELTLPWNGTGLAQASERGFAILPCDEVASKREDATPVPIYDVEGIVRCFPRRASAPPQRASMQAFTATIPTRK